MATLTETVRRMIEKDEPIEPEEWLEVLKDEGNFNTISKELTRTMSNKLSRGEDPETLAPLLTESIESLEPMTKEQKKSSGQNVKKWFYEDVVPERENAIKICFALNLDADEAMDFLHKGCGLPGFSYRNAEDLIYFYCLLNIHDMFDNNGLEAYRCARDLITRYHDGVQNNSGVGSNSFQATQTLRAVFGQVEGKDKEIFLNDLISNHNSFFGYSVTAAQQYRNLCDSVRWKRIEIDISTYKDGGDDIEDMHYPVITRFAKQTKKLIKDNLVQIPSLSNNKNISIEDVCDHFASIKESYKNVSNVSDILKKILPTRDLYRTMFTGVPENNGEFQYKLKKPKDGKEIISNFPRTEYLDEFDRTLEIAINKPKSRKILITLYFFDELYKLRLSTSPIDTDNFYSNFVEGINYLLFNCGMPYLYPRDRFDNLIMKSIHSQFERDSFNEPDDFLNEILEFILKT